MAYDDSLEEEDEEMDERIKALEAELAGIKDDDDGSPSGGAPKSGSPSVKSTRSASPGIGARSPVAAKKVEQNLSRILSTKLPTFFTCNTGIVFTV